MAGSSRDHSFIGKAEVAAVANDDVVEHSDAQKSGGFGKFDGYSFVFRTRGDIGAGVVVHADDRGGEFLESTVNDFPHHGHGLIYRTVRGIGNIDDFIICVEIDYFEDLGF